MRNYKEGNVMVNNKLTFEERLEIEKLLKQNIPKIQISRNIKRNSATIYSEIKNNGGPLHYEAVKAQENADLSNERRSQSLKKWNAIHRPPTTVNQYRVKLQKLSEQLFILEQKVDILEKIIQHKQGNC